MNFRLGRIDFGQLGFGKQISALGNGDRRALVRLSQVAHVLPGMIRKPLTLAPPSSKGRSDIIVSEKIFASHPSTHMPICY